MTVNTLLLLAIMCIYLTKPILSLEVNVCNPTKTLRHFQLRSDRDCNKKSVVRINDCDNTMVYNPTLASLKISAHACTIQVQPYSSYY